MKIVLTGGGSGGHFYPIIAVAQAIRKVIREEKLLEAELYYMAPTPYDKKALFENGITFRKTSAGKLRRYFSIMNFFDVFRTAWGILSAFKKMFSIFPDVVFSKGGYVSVPVVLAARLLGIPVVIHESDSVPGKANKWAGKFATRVAVSYPEAAQYFPKDKIAHTGNPLRSEVLFPVKEGAREFLGIEENTPVVLVLGGSQGAQIINENIIDALPEIVQNYQIIHQTGQNNFIITQETVNVVLQNNAKKNRYKPYPFLDTLTLRMAAGVADLVISRAGSTIFEIAAWGIPSIIIPISSSNGDHQRQNAFNYGRTGACTVIEESNLTSHILTAEIRRIFDRPGEREKMAAAAKQFAKINSAELIAREIITIGLEHEA